MDVSGWLLRFAAGAPHVFVVEVAGGAAVRWAVEDLVVSRGWVTALSPADADLVVLAGPGDSVPAEAIELVWGQVPAPRVRVVVDDPGAVPDVLSDAVARLAVGGEALSGAQQGTGHQHDDHDDHGTDHGGGHGGGHDHHGGVVAGLAMAERAPDRDGLALDRLHVVLGPVLVDWPAGLVLELALQGDVVQEAAARRDAGSPVPDVDPRVVLLDALARLLAVAGWPDAVLRARRLRAAVLAGVVDDARLRRFTRRVRRSRTLRWLTSGIGEIGGGDVTARWVAWLDEIEGHRTAPRHARALDVLPGLVRGHELGAVRLIVASLGPDLDREP
ncbi:hypothetical protein [Saccharopolyspora sp. CA-218241]|uniref:hypothetical protein n=1 Tax=Saccharopolyspora sp. CA-218241 TaxID=3240027 RepID=UPI003D98AD73